MKVGYNFKKLLDFIDDKQPQQVAILQGATRSGKTYSILQYLVYYCKKNANQGKLINIVRQKLTWLKTSLLVDLLEILNNNDIEYKFNKSDMFIELYGNTIRFISLDDPSKLKGLRGTITYVNEITETIRESYEQILMRSQILICDFNPNLNSHYIYDVINERASDNNTLFYISRPIHNAFLPESTLQYLKSLDPNNPENVINGSANEFMYKVYALGERAPSEGLVFPNINWIDELPPNLTYSYAMDYGFSSDPSTLVKCGVDGNNLYVQGMMYENGLTTDQIADYLNKLNVGKTKIYGDSAESRLIYELAYKHKFKIFPVVKTRIIESIELMRNYNLYFVKNPDLIKEAENYTYKKLPDGTYDNTPIDDFNHYFDAIRYYSIMNLSSLFQKKGKKRISY